jgi:hypothetical protein
MSLSSLTDESLSDESFSENKPTLRDFTYIIEQRFNDDYNECFSDIEHNGDPNCLREVYHEELNKITDNTNTEWCEKMANELYLILNILLKSLPTHYLELPIFIIEVINNHLYNNEMFLDIFNVD